MKKTLAAGLIIAIGLIAIPNCASAPPNVSPQAAVAFKADQIVVRVNELQRAATAANAAGSLDTNLTRQIVTWTVAADKILKDTPQGWVATLKASWEQVKQNVNLRTITQPAIQLAFTAVDALIGALA